MYLSGGCQASSLVIRGRLDFLYRWVLQVTGLKDAVGLHLNIVLVESVFVNQLLYLPFARAFLLKLIIASNPRIFKLFMFANVKALLNFTNWSC